MRAAAYARYSTNNQTENSIAYQMDKIQKYCKENNITLTAFYADEGETGTNMERAGFMNMFHAAQRKEFEAVVIYDISRGSRDVADWFTFRKQMAALNIQVISCTQKLGNIYNSNDFLVELISVGLGQREVLETRQKSIDGVAIKAHEGKFLGGVAPLGYSIINGDYVVNPSEAIIVKKIFRMYAAGCGYSEIISSLESFTGRYGKPFNKNSLSSILRNERYIGTYSWNKRKVRVFRKWAGGTPNPNAVIIKDSIPRIIDDETWNAVQERIHNNKRNASHKAKREYLLSGLIECSSCGAAYVGRASMKHTSNGKTYETLYYGCGNKYRSKKCNAKNIKAEELETFVLDNLKEYIKTADFKLIANYIAEQVNLKSNNIDNEKAELAQIDKKIKNGINAILNGADIPELSAEIDALRLRKAELEDIINISKINSKRVSPAAIEEMFIQAAKNIETSNIKELVKTFVQKIYANPDGSATVIIGITFKQKNNTDKIGVTVNSGGLFHSVPTKNTIPQEFNSVNKNFLILETFSFKQ